MALSVLSALELDQKSTENKFVLIEENNTSDGSFIVSSFLEKAVKKNDKIVIMLFHHSIGHYHAIAQKLHYKLSEYQEKGNVFAYDFLKCVMNDVLKEEDALKLLFLDVREKISELQQSNNVTLVIDNIGNLLLYGFGLKSCMLFVHYCLMLLNEYRNVSITFLVHNFSDCDEFTVLLNNLRHKAHVNIVVDDLKSGKAADVSGRFSVKWRTCDNMQWQEANEYHYLLLDMNVNVFAPGTRYL